MVTGRGTSEHAARVNFFRIYIEMVIALNIVVAGHIKNVQKVVLVITGIGGEKNPHWKKMNSTKLLPGTITLGRLVHDHAIGLSEVLLLHNLVQRPHQELLPGSSVYRDRHVEGEQSVLQVARPLLNLRTETIKNATDKPDQNLPVDG